MLHHKNIDYVIFIIQIYSLQLILLTAWKVSKYGVFSGPYFPALGLKYLSVVSPNVGKYGPENTQYLDTFQTVTDRSMQETTNLMDRQLTWPHFIESCGHEVLLWYYYINEEASQFRNKVAKIISTEINPVNFHISKN